MTVIVLGRIHQDDLFTVGAIARKAACALIRSFEQDRDRSSKISCDGDADAK
jgi:hypothetical protein